MSFLDEEPQGGETTKWLGGVVAPSPFVIYGLMCIINRVGAVPAGRRPSDNIPFFGIDAVILGVACLSFASLIHFHYYWGLSDQLKDKYEYGKLASLLTLISSFAWCILRGFMELY